MSEPTFWENPAVAREVIDESTHLKNQVNPAQAFHSKVEDLEAMLELVDEMGEDPESEGFQQEILDHLSPLQKELEKLELASFLNEPNDGCHAFLTVKSGAGGTESCDWAEMLLRMYTRWAESAGYATDVLDIQPGEEAGISSATIRIMGPNAFGYSKSERGVHRLVRISPFDSNARRHTSFCSVDVVAEIEDSQDIDIHPDDIRTDVYRASGKGGQHVNRTESAVRLTHIPTGIVVTCQNERSQIKNKATAMKTLKSRLYEKQEDEKRNEMEKIYSEKGEIAWGNQIRSYVFQPYRMVKDLRTGVETGNVQAVMDGELDPFIHSWLRAGKPTSRTNAANREFSDE